MEPSRVAQRCLRSAITRPTTHKYPTNTQSCSSASNKRSRSLISSDSHSTTLRSFTSSTRKTQGRPSQPQPVSEELSAEDVGADALTTPQEQIAQASNREYTQNSRLSKLDLSSIPGINAHPEDSKAGRRTTSTTSNANTSTSTSRAPNAHAQLNKLFNDYSQKRQQEQQQSQQPNTRSSSDSWADTLDAFSIPQQRRTNPPQSSSTQSSRFDIKNIISPFDPASSSPSLLDLSSSKLPLRLRPTLGRTQPVDVSRGMDLTRAFRTMEARCIQNNVKSDMMAQRTHVRRGKAKKLNRSRRWREVFKAGFLAECGRVRRMQKQGW